MKSIIDLLNESTINEDKLSFPYYEGYYLVPSQTKGRALTLQNITVYNHTKRNSFQDFDECKQAVLDHAELNKKLNYQCVIVEQNSGQKSDIVWILTRDGKEIDLRK